MTDESISDAVRRIMGDVFAAEPSAISETAEMGDLPNWDSGNHVVMIMAIEEEFHINFSVEEFESMTSFKDVVAGIEQKL
jgi:acyl carrier protein